MTICIFAHFIFYSFRPILPTVAAFLGKHGRGMYVKPLFIELNRLDSNLALKTYDTNKSYYHAVIKSFCENLLKI